MFLNGRLLIFPSNSVLFKRDDIFLIKNLKNVNFQKLQVTPYYYRIIKKIFEYIYIYIIK